MNFENKLYEISVQLVLNEIFFTKFMFFRDTEHFKVEFNAKIIRIQNFDLLAFRIKINSQ